MPDAREILDRLHLDHRILTKYHLRVFFPGYHLDIWPTTRKFCRIGLTSTLKYNSLEKLLIAEAADVTFI